MGWTFTHHAPGMSDQALFERAFPDTLGGSILASATVGDTFYAAWTRAQARAVKPGMAVKFAKPVDFGDGRVHDTLTLAHRSTFRGPDGLLYKVSKWRTHYAWEVAGEHPRQCPG